MNKNIVKKISVLYVSPFAHRPGHHGSAMVRESAALQKAGANVTVVTFSEINGVLENGITHIKVSTGRKYSVWRFVSEMVEQAQVLVKTARLCKNSEFDVVLYRDAILLPLIPLVCSLFVKDNIFIVPLNAWLVKEELNMSSYLVKYGNWLTKKYRIWLQLNTFIFVGFDKYTAENFRAYAKENLDLNNDDVKYIPLGVDYVKQYVSNKKAREYIGLPLDKKVVLLFGAVHEGKDVETIVRAFKDLEDVILLIVGKFIIPKRYEWAQRFIKVNKMKNVILKNEYVSEEEKKYYFCAADVIIVGMKKDFLWSASMVLEVAKYQIPVIASDVGELADVMHEYPMGLTFFCEDVGSLRQVIKKFFLLSNCRVEEMRQNCKCCADEFALDTWAKRHLELYKSLINRQKRVEH